MAIDTIDMTPIQQQRHDYYERKKAEGYHTVACPLCGGPKSRYSTKCSRHRPDGSLIEQRCDCGADHCDVKGPHRRCDCGEVIFPDQQTDRYAEVCAHCIAWSTRMAMKRAAMAS